MGKTKLPPEVLGKLEQEAGNEINCLIERVTQINEVLRRTAAKCIVNDELSTEAEIAINEIANSTIMKELAFVAEKYIIKYLSLL